MRWLVFVVTGCSFQAGVASSGRDDGGGVQLDSPLAIDAAQDAFDPMCFGPSPFTVCLAALPTTALTIPALTDIDTTMGSAGECDNGAGVVLEMNATQVCVIAQTSITTVGDVGSSGPLPLVLVATSTITITNLFDASSDVTGSGPGANDSTCSNVLTTFGIDANGGNGGGGGAGGSFGGAGANGGAGSAGGAAAGAAQTATQPPVELLRGGCPGGRGGSGTGQTANGGDGGGAIYLVARGSITISGTLTASGGGGTAGTSVRGGGGGGGSGGMIVIDAPSVMISGQAFSNGGGGGGGASGASAGTDGSDATMLGTAASGGVTLSIEASAGGNGGFLATPATAATQASDGGGGGGGGVGVIRILSGQSFTSASVSPAPS